MMSRPVPVKKKKQGVCVESCDTLRTSRVRSSIEVRGLMNQVEQSRLNAIDHGRPGTKTTRSDNQAWVDKDCDATHEERR